jgi:uncharacterized membrane protein YgcG
LPPDLKLMDTVGLLDDAESQRLQAAAAAVLGDFRVELIVYVVDSVQGRDFREHAVASRSRMASDKDNSILLVVSLRDRHAEIATAPRYAGLFTPDAASALLRRTLVPLMREDRPVDAVASALGGMCQRLKGGAGRRPFARKYRVAAAILALVLALAGVAIWSYVRGHTCKHCGGWCRIETLVTQEATQVSTGTKELHYSCSRCGGHYVEVRTLPVLSSSDSTSSWTDSSSSDFGSSDSSSSSSDSGDSGGGSDGGGGADW